MSFKSTSHANNTPTNLIVFFMDVVMLCIDEQKFTTNMMCLRGGDTI